MSKRRNAGVAGLACAITIAVGSWSCGHDSATGGGTANGDGGASAACPPCVTDQDCAGGGTCAQLGSDSACAPPCPNGNECSSDRACVAVTTVTGQQASVCVPRTDECGGIASGGDAGVSGTCGTLVDPTTKAGCTSCTGRPTCQPNGCYGGWWCDTATNRCQAPPASCSGSSGGSALDAGPPVTANVGPNGGTASRLLFAVVGDTRPANIDDTSGYPSAVVGKIYSQLEAFQPHVPFLLTTGDYMFASTTRGQAGPQLDLYLKAQGAYRGQAFPAMGNHECTGATASNCGPGTTDGTTDNYDQFLAKMLAPLQKSEPYYAMNVNAPDSSWTAKFVFVAANAWSTTQQSWLDSALTPTTTYTFVIRHESHDANTAPGVSPSDAVIARHPLTLKIVGHTHTYERYTSNKEVVVGNGGAPLTGSKTYGFALFNQRPDGAIEVDMLNWQTSLADTSFRFAVKPDGSAAP